VKEANCELKPEQDEKFRLNNWESSSTSQYSSPSIAPQGTSTLEPSTADAQRPDSALSISSSSSSTQGPKAIAIERSNSTSTVTSEQKSEPEVVPDVVSCQWDSCSEQVDSGLLMQHISEAHVKNQSKSFVCQWQGCKVFNKPSTNKSWLERHILHHSGDKPFCCIVNGCHMRFPSQFSLERHVNSHFNSDLIPHQKSAKNRDDTPTKMLRKRKLRRKRLWQGMLLFPLSQNCF
jgi:zinc finger protein AEBP2